MFVKHSTSDNHAVTVHSPYKVSKQGLEYIINGESTSSMLQLANGGQLLNS